MRHALMRGSLIAALGIALLVYAGAFIPAATLHIWGWLIYAFGIGLITFGLLPYRRLSRLEKKPHEIIVDDKDRLLFLLRGRKTFSVPTQSIDTIEFAPEKYMYGIAINLKRPIEGKVIVHDSSFNMQRFMDASQKKHRCDLFLPYFTNRSCNILKEHLQIPA